MPDLPPLNALKTFESAARHLSFRRAAEDLNVTPAAVSHQIHVLEAFLGMALFERTKKGLALTPAARACLPKLQDSFATMRDSMAMMNRFKGKETLTVSCAPSFANRWLMPRLHRFLMQRPDLDVHIISRMHGYGHSWTARESESASARDWAEEADIVLMLGNGKYGDLHVTPLLPLTLTPMYSPNLTARPDESSTPFAALASASALAQSTASASVSSAITDVRQLLTLPLLHDDRGLLYCGKSFWRLWAEQMNLLAPEDSSGHHFSHAVFALEAAIDGLGTVVSAPSFAIPDLQSGRLLAPFPMLENVGADYYTVTSERAAERPSTIAFLDWLQGEALKTTQELHAVCGLAIPLTAKGAK